MAKRGTKKALSLEHEAMVADSYNDGQRSNSSGGAITDEGDVRVISERTLFECKGQFGELTGKHAVRSTLLSQFEKITDEAYSVNLEPAVALRFYAPESILANQEGYVDFVVRLLDDDAHRAWLLEHFRQRACAEEGRWHSS